MKISTKDVFKRAHELQNYAASKGFDWNNIDEVLAKLDEEVFELKQSVKSGLSSDIKDELGDVMFTVINIARHLNINENEALEQANNKFNQRFSTVEEITSSKGVDMAKLPLNQLEQYWQQAKGKES